MTQTKASLRRDIMAARKAHHAAHGPDAASALAAQADALALPPQQTIAAYMPMGSEIDCRPLLADLAARGHRLCLPVCIDADAPMRFRAYHHGDKLVADAAGALAPGSEAANVQPDIVFLPLIGFDRDGMRLGRGGGYYDRTLEDLRARRSVAAYGLAYDMQLLDKCPAAPHDQALDAVLTETTMHRFGRG